MRHGLLFRAVLSASLLVGTPTLALAADPSPQDIAQARDLSGQAIAAFEAGNYAESEKLWIAASNLYPAAPTLTLGLARTQAKLGKFVLAQESYQKIIREQSQATSLTPAFKDALESARSELTEVATKIASVVIHVDGAPNPSVKIDGQPISSAGLGLKRPVDPGSHVVRAEAPGYTPAETTFDVAEAGSAEAKLHLEKATDAPAAGSGDAATVAPNKKSSNKTLALAAFGVGGAGLVFGAVTGIVALGKHGDLSDQCPDGRCPDGLRDDIDSYGTMGTLSTIGFIVGGVGLAAGAVLWFTAPKESAAATAAMPTAHGSFSWQPYVGAGGGGVRGRF
jgi:hypothetical protein